MPDRAERAMLSGLLSGALSGVLVAVMSVSMAAMIFNGPLAGHLGAGIHLVFTSAIVVGLATAIFSRCQPVIAMVDEDTAPIFALLAAFVVASMPAEAAPQEVLFTVLVAILFSTILSGLGLALLGLMRFGGFIQFLPHSVLGGYLAALGCLLVVGGLGVAAPGFDLTLGTFSSVGGGDISRLLPALAIALWLILMQGRLNSTWLLPLTIVAVIVVWYVGLAVTGGSVSDPEVAAHFVGALGGGEAGALRPLIGVDIKLLNLASVLSNLGGVATIFLISVFSLMLTISGLAHLHQQETNMDRELILAGVANMASGASGGMTGLPSFTLSALTSGNTNSGSRLPGLTSVGVCLVIYIFFLDYIQYLPRSILAGILIYLGLALIKEWLIGGVKKFATLEYLVIPIILLVSVLVGFLQGVLVGLISAIILFVMKYSSISAIRYIGTGREFSSNVDRNTSEQECLRSQGEQMMIIALQGYLFFGTSGGVYSRIRDRLAGSSDHRLSYLVLDFSGTSGLDASAAINFQKVAQLASKDNFQLLFAGLDVESIDRLEPVLMKEQSQNRFRQLADLDHALEWCEEDVLSRHPEVERIQGCFDQLPDFMSDEEVEMLLSYLERREVVSGEVLTEQGDHATELYFLETCSASAFIRTSTGQVSRVRRSNQGTVFGELGFYLETPRTASVVVESPGIVYVLQREALLRMEEESPEIAAELNRYMAMLMSERLMFTTRTLRAVSA
ncbi:MAG: SulP family inorganic anion transporter [Halioglobus sp.]